MSRATAQTESGRHERQLATGALAQQFALAVNTLIMLAVVTVLARSLTLSAFGTYGLLVSIASYLLLVQTSVEAAAVEIDLDGARSGRSRSCVLDSGSALFGRRVPSRHACCGRRVAFSRTARAPAPAPVRRSPCRVDARCGDPNWLAGEDSSGRPAREPSVCGRGCGGGGRLHDVRCRDNLDGSRGRAALAPDRFRWHDPSA